MSPPVASPTSASVTKPADTALNAGVSTPFTGSWLHTYTTTNGTVSLQTSATDAVVVSRDIGAGHVVLIGTDYFTLGTGMDRVIANAVKLAQPAAAGNLPVAPPNTTAFVAGEWSGNLSVPFTANGVRLRATSGTIAGDSNIFDVGSATAPSSTAAVFSEDFESGTLNPSYWTVTGTGPYHTQVNSLYAPHAGTRHMTMDSTGGLARNEATLTVNLAGRTGAVLKFWAAGYGDEPNGPPTSPFTGGADFDGVAISADGTTWWEVQALRSLPSTYAQFTVDLDAAIAARGISYGSSFKIRFNQYDDNPLTTDGIVVDDILITANAPPTNLTFTIPPQVTEGAGTISGTINITPAPTSDLVLNLSSKSPAKITVPATVTIPAGQTTASLSLNVLDDSFVDGTKAVVITASGSGILETGTTIQVIDNDGGALGISLPATVAENAGAANGTLTLSVPPLLPMTVTLVSDNPAAAQVPTMISVPREPRAWISPSLFQTTLRSTAIRLHGLPQPWRLDPRDQQSPGAG
jgi:hypothetical protein